MFVINLVDDDERLLLAYSFVNHWIISVVGVDCELVRDVLLEEGGKYSVSDNKNPSNFLLC